MRDALEALVDALSNYERSWLTSNTGYGPVAVAKKNAHAALAARSEAGAEGLRYHPVTGDGDFAQATMQDRLDTLADYWRSEGMRLAARSEADDVLQSAYRMALMQIEHDGEVINRLTRALRVATHDPHDRDGEPDSESGFPTCSGCGAILTDAARAETEPKP